MGGGGGGVEAVSQNGRWKDGSCLRSKAPCGGRFRAVRLGAEDISWPLWWVLGPRVGWAVHSSGLGSPWVVSVEQRGGGFRSAEGWLLRPPRKD